MQTIWKFPIAVEDRFHVEMPVGALVLSVQVQNGQPCIWAQVDTGAKKQYRDFAIFGTGHPMPDNLGNFVGTFQMNSGRLVFHLYEIA